MKKTIYSLVLLVVSTILLASCGGGKKINIWVGIESVDFYTEKIAEYTEAYAAKHGSEIGRAHV